MRDAVAAVAAFTLIFVALSLLTALHTYRRRLDRRRASEGALGRTIIAELPTSSELVLFTGDEGRFYYGDDPIDKDLIQTVRVLINGSPIASYASSRSPAAHDTPVTSFEDRPEGIARDRWDVAIETERGSTLVECGAIRERVSQELARSIYDAVREDMERRDRAAGASTTPPRAGPRGDSPRAPARTADRRAD